MIAGMTEQYLGPAGVAAIIGVAPATVRGYASQGGMPEPDVKIDSTSGWSEETIAKWIANRPGRGARKRPAGG
jgi:predicted DNA-binding transcriptional regulator AlpA